MTNRGTITDLFLETFRLNGRLLVIGDDLVAEVGLTSARWQVLGAIALSQTPLSVSHIARNMGLTRQAVQRLVNEMERDKLVRLDFNPHHQRAKLVVLTTRGQTAYTAAMRRYNPWAKDLADMLTTKQIETTTKVLRILREHLDDSTRGNKRHA